MRLYEEGLIFRAKRMINWDPVERDRGVRPRGRHRRGERLAVGDPYPIVGGGGEIVVATTRPETMLGDTAVAVHPDDERYKHLHRQAGRAAADRPPDPDRRATTHARAIRRSAPARSRSRRRTIRTTTRSRQRNDLPILQVIDAQGQDLRAGAGEVRRHDRRRGAQGGGRRPRGRRASLGDVKPTTRCRAAAASARAR